MPLLTITPKNDLCDTNILSELARPTPNQGVIEWAAKVPSLYLSVITVDEIYFGLKRRPKAKIQKWFETYLANDCEVLPVTTEIAKYAGELRGELSLKGQVRSQADMLIAATAFIHGLRLVTRNERDFKECHIVVMNPFV
jgi:predicted nucleic acid-binding protein